MAYVGYALLAIQSGAFLDWYIHIDRATVAVGQLIIKGQLVAYSGNKVPGGGVSFGPHLHFEVQEGVFYFDVYGRPRPLNRPSTSRDPIPVIQYAAGSATGELGEDMTDDQALQLKNTTDKVNEMWDLVRTGFHFAGSPRWIFTELEDIKGAIAAIKPGAAPADLSTVNSRLDALTAAITGLQSKLANLVLKSS